MASGGPRNRSGPPVDPNSGRSDARGVRFDALPAEGFSGTVPDWPLPRRVVKVWESGDGVRYQVTDHEATTAVAERELDLWRWAWRTPQACAWAKPSESWRLHSIAMWVRTFVVCESSEATAADKNSLHRFADQIGLTPAGLKENGWQVARDQVAEKRAEQGVEEPAARSSRERMKVVKGGRG